ncbi:MAG TPA: alanine--glyoxylate aminotransferase family protein [Rhizomicrobium sp.]|nr:alanine--glyoxylate aminotransferase family protein [Rhizomicrobium sp.]
MHSVCILAGKSIQFRRAVLGLNSSTGTHFLQIPGPSPVPERILRAIDRQVIDHRGPEFQHLGIEVLEGCRTVFGTSHPVIIYPSSGTGGWEAAIANTLSPGDRVLMVETGQFAALWRNLATRWGIDVQFLPGDWRHGVNAADIEVRLAEDKGHTIKAVMVIHNETSTGALSDIQAVRRAIDQAGHPALLMVDAISSLGSAPVCHDAWCADVTVSCSQKGLMLPPGISLMAVSEKALAASRSNKLPRSYWDWSEMLASNAKGFFPYTPSTNLLYGLRESLRMLQEEGLENVFARHRRLAKACRAAVTAWGLEVLCVDRASYSPVLTAILLPPGRDADAFRAAALQSFDISLGAGLGKVAGKVFRIGHLGACNDLTLMAALCGVEMTLQAQEIPFEKSGVLAAMQSLSGFDGSAQATEPTAAIAL